MPAIYDDFADDAVSDAAERQRRLEAKLLQISTEQRRRIGQDLHDGLQQSLTAIAFALQRLENRLRLTPQPGDFDPASASASIHRMVDAAIDQTRHIAHGLYPVKLERDGLSAGLDELSKSMSRLYEVECRFVDHDKVGVLDCGVATHLYRIAQEAVNNAVRHGHAQRIRISLQRVDGGLRLTISDNGEGFEFDPALQSAERHGIGLQTMRHRSEVIGCKLEIVSRLGVGTRVVVDLPEHLLCEGCA